MEGKNLLEGHLEGILGHLEGALQLEGSLETMIRHYIVREHGSYKLGNMIVRDMIVREHDRR